jgi:hypoxanthine phosphoribosyltransferase
MPLALAKTWLPMDVKEYIDAARLTRRVREMAAEIVVDYHEPPLMVGILNGAVQFMMDLIAALPTPFAAAMQYDFVDLSSYVGKESSGEVKLSKDLAIEVYGRDVLLVDGIVDTGMTIEVLLAHLTERGAHSIKVCALLDKPSRRRCVVPVNYKGFVIDDVFVVGYGMDFAQSYRALPYVGVFEE